MTIIQEKELLKDGMKKWKMKKKNKKKHRKPNQTRIDLAILEKKLRNIKNYDEDDKINDYIRNMKDRRKIRDERYEYNDETISKEDLK